MGEMRCDFFDIYLLIIIFVALIKTKKLNNVFIITS